MNIITIPSRRFVLQIFSLQEKIISPGVLTAYIYSRGGDFVNLSKVNFPPETEEVFNLMYKKAKSKDPELSRKKFWEKVINGWVKPYSNKLDFKS